jgi:hypothetical protein
MTSVLEILVITGRAEHIPRQVKAKIILLHTLHVKNERQECLWGSHFSTRIRFLGAKFTHLGERLHSLSWFKLILCSFLWRALSETSKQTKKTSLLRF